MPTVPCALLERWACLMMQCNGDLNALIEIQITDTYLRDLLQRHRCLLKDQFVVMVILEAFNFLYRLLLWVRLKASLLCRGCVGKIALLDDRWGQYCYVFYFQYFYCFSPTELLVFYYYHMLLLKRQSMAMGWQASFCSHLFVAASFCMSLLCSHNYTLFPLIPSAALHFKALLNPPGRVSTFSKLIYIVWLLYQ